MDLSVVVVPEPASVFVMVGVGVVATCGGGSGVRRSVERIEEGNVGVAEMGIDVRAHQCPFDLASLTERHAKA